MADPIYQEIMQAIGTGRTFKSLEASHLIKDLRLEFLEIQVIKGRQLMTYQGRIYIPSPAVSDVLKALHEGHGGVVRCLAAAKQTVFWPTMAKDIARDVEKCKLCTEFSNKKEQPPQQSTHLKHP